MKMFLLRKIQLVFAVTEENCKLRQDVTALLSGKEVKLAAACVWLVPEDPPRTKSLCLSLRRGRDRSALLVTQAQTEE